MSGPLTYAEIARQLAAARAELDKRQEYIDHYTAELDHAQSKVEQLRQERDTARHYESEVVVLERERDRLRGDLEAARESLEDISAWSHDPRRPNAAEPYKALNAIHDRARCILEGTQANDWSDGEAEERSGGMPHP